jgi:hypothetical protein
MNIINQKLSKRKSEKKLKEVMNIEEEEKKLEKKNSDLEETLKIINNSSPILTKKESKEDISTYLENLNKSNHERIKKIKNIQIKSPQPNNNSKKIELIQISKVEINEEISQKEIKLTNFHIKYKKNENKIKKFNLILEKEDIDLDELRKLSWSGNFIYL